VKSHGGTDALGFASAIDLAIDMGGSDMIARILKDRAGISSVAEQSVSPSEHSNGAGTAQAAVS
jgi:glycerol-3-phosphate acyltransferase PlsX